MTAICIAATTALLALAVLCLAWGMRRHERAESLRHTADDLAHALDRVEATRPTVDEINSALGYAGAMADWGNNDRRGILADIAAHRTWRFEETARRAEWIAWARKVSRTSLGDEAALRREVESHVVDIDLDALNREPVRLGYSAAGDVVASSTDLRARVLAPSIRLALLGWVHPLRGDEARVREDGHFACPECDGFGEVWCDIEGDVRCEACGGDGRDAARDKALVEDGR